jgi:hypothetical protein
MVPGAVWPMPTEYEPHTQNGVGKSLPAAAEPVRRGGRKGQAGCAKRRTGRGWVVRGECGRRRTALASMAAALTALRGGHRCSA